MPEILFYHLTTRSLEQAVPAILEKCVERGLRVVLRTGSEERAEALNRWLWTYREDGFLPHGGPSDPSPERQPIYLTSGDETPNAPQVLFLCDGAEARIDEMVGFDRAILMFDGRDEEGVNAARTVWKAAAAADAPAVYWAQTETGAWTKKG